MIHVAGTKGKGSTSAFVSSIFSEYPHLIPSAPSTHSPHARRHNHLKIGLYTSPHLRTVRERIRINNTPISPFLFSKYFFETWDRIGSSKHVSPLLSPPEEDKRPNYFRFLTLTAFHTFLSENVDVAIMECGMGGAYDSTNIVPSPLVTAVTSLGLDHLDQLGPSIENIAWHKSGIFKREAPRFTVYTAADQPRPTMHILHERAREANKALMAIPTRTDIATGTVPISLEGEFQKVNASMAVAIASAWMQQREVPALDLPGPGTEDPLPEEFKAGLKKAKWPGRCEVRQDRGNNVVWYIDGGHTLESVEGIVDWFSKHLQSNHRSDTPRILLFNQQTRDAATLLKALNSKLQSAILPITKTAGRASTEDHDHDHGKDSSMTQQQSVFTHAIFTPNTPFSTSNPLACKAGSLQNRTSDTDVVDSLSLQCSLAEEMAQLDLSCETHVVKNLEEAVGLVRHISKATGGQLSDGQSKTAVLATGSLHLVGSLTEVLESEEEQAIAGAVERR